MHGDIEKLGIAVVYLVSERNGRLLDLHLSQIEKNTEVPYTIYGSANRLLPQFRPVLEKNPNVRICECETFDVSNWTDRHTVIAGSREEHSFYLEQLIKQAIDDGVSHVAILHVDSFPIAPGWARKLAAGLSETCVLAGIVRDQKADCKPLTACILFARDFYLKYNPRLLPTREEFASAEYQRYRAAVPHQGDCGTGYGLKMFTEKLTWSQLARSNRAGEHPLFAGLYDDLIFHLGAAAFKDSTQSVGFSPQHRRKGALRSSVKKGMDSLLGPRIRRTITDCIPLKIRRPDKHAEQVTWEDERRRLLEDPESYFRYLRTGQE
ncbi:MAG: hypothetical protein JSU70_23640 [Phycisphaerales bacterium]|nr:MAG: hypothetical protein JSU70_23640 [Phycisphaerales bacterium]